MFEKVRAPLVPGENVKSRGDTVYNSTSSLTVVITVGFALAAIAVHEQHYLVAANNSKLGIRMILDHQHCALISQLDPSYETFKRSDGTIVVRLHEAIYGCIQSAKFRCSILKSALGDDGYTRSLLHRFKMNFTSSRNHLFPIISNATSWTVQLKVY